MMKKTLQRFIDHAITQLKSNSRVCGLAVGGSWITDDIDDFSDLDLIIIAADDGYPRVFDERFAITKSLGNNVSCFTGEHVGEPRLLICLFSDPLIHVDIKFVALRDFHERIENPWIAWEVDGVLTEALRQSAPKKLDPNLQWIEDRIWTWIHYGTAKVARGEIFEAVGFLSFLREQVLGPLALNINGKAGRGVRRIEQRLPDFSIKLRKTLPSYEKRDCLDAIRAAAELYIELRAQNVGRKIKFNEKAESETLAYLAKVSSDHSC
jgi:predicted nucleotidyltransferase